MKTRRVVAAQRAVRCADQTAEENTAPELGHVRAELDALAHGASRTSCTCEEPRRPARGPVIRSRLGTRDSDGLEPLRRQQEQALLAGTPNTIVPGTERSRIFMERARYQYPTARKTNWPWLGEPQSDDWCEDPPSVPYPSAEVLQDSAKASDPSAQYFFVSGWGFLNAEGDSALGSFPYVSHRGPSHTSYAADGGLELPLDDRPYVDPNVKHVIVYVHGRRGTDAADLMNKTTSGAQLYYEAVHAAIDKAGGAAFQQNEVAVIAPLFQEPAYKPFTDVASVSWYWSGGANSAGARSRKFTPGDYWFCPPADTWYIVPAQVSSFFPIDLILRKIPAKYPQAETVVVAGHSRGGQLVLRHALMGIGTPQWLAWWFGIKTRFVGFNPGSYPYFTPLRLIPSNWDKINVPQGIMDPDPPPPPGPLVWKAPLGCDDYDDWRFGFEGPKFPRRTLSQEFIKNLDLPVLFGGDPSERQLFGFQYSTMDVWHVQSADDDSFDPGGGTSCATLQQGISRYDRWRHFFQSLAEQAPFGVDFGPLLPNFRAPPGLALHSRTIISSDVGLKAVGLV